eukprot:TRINITY_DN5071_c0_g1_i2.p1 TRINITY_DN5071_c0_g1~~TRINITY_DN5071_c0_g1_i2.p1  ORF type:complete len:980 (+),score=264.56 TRINITY_DN5071_c0_g1_i2:138-3077(+)
MGDLWTAARANDVATLSSFFSKGIGARARDDKGNTLLHHAAETGSMSVLELLFNKGVDLDAKNNEGFTPVISAAKALQENAVIWLVSHGANPALKTTLGISIATYLTSEEFTARLSAAKRAWIQNKSGSAPTPVPTQAAVASPDKVVAAASFGALSTPSVAAALGAPTSPETNRGVGAANRRTVNLTNPALLQALRVGTLRGSGLDLDTVTAAEPAAAGRNDPMISEFSRNRAGSISAATATQKARSTDAGRRAPHPFTHSQSMVADSSSSMPIRTEDSLSTKPSGRRMLHSMSVAEASSVQRRLLQQMNEGERQRKADGSTSPRKMTTSEGEPKTPTKSTSDSQPASPRDEQPSPRGDSTSASEETTPRKKKGFFRSKKNGDDKKPASAPVTPAGPDAVSKTSSSKSKDKKDKSTDKDKGKKSSSSSKDKDKDKKHKKKEKSPSKSKIKYSTMTTEQLAAAGIGAGQTKQTNAAAANGEADAAQKEPAAASSSSSSRSKMTEEEKKKKRSTMTVAQEKSNVSLAQALPATAAASQQPANVQRRSLVEAVYTESINLEALTDATCKLVAAVCHPKFGSADYELAVLFDAVKAFSAVLKQMLSVIDGYATTFEDLRQQEALLTVAAEMKATNSKELFEGIKALTSATPSDAKPLLKAVRNIVINVWKLYVASEATQVDDILNSLQTAVLTTKNLMTGAGDATPEELSMLADLTVIGALRVSSLVQEHTFSTARASSIQRQLHEAGFMQAQAVRGLVLASTEYNRLRENAAIAGHTTSPALEAANNNMTALLKKVAEQVRAISKHLSDEKATVAGPYEPMAEAACNPLFNRGVGLITNARDKYYNRAASTHIAEDEKALLDAATQQAQLFKDLAGAFGRRDGAMMMDIAAHTAEIVVKISSIVQPFLEHTMDQFVREQCLLGIESSIRCDIQLKILLSAAALNIHDVGGLDVYLAAHIVQLWGVYWTFLLDSVWRAAQIPI